MLFLMAYKSSVVNTYTKTVGIGLNQNSQKLDRCSSVSSSTTAFIACGSLSNFDIQVLISFRIWLRRV